MQIKEEEEVVEEELLMLPRLIIDLLYLGEATILSSRGRRNKRLLNPSTSH
jgi:hypothetical protein